MVVEVRLFATLREGRFKKRQMEFAEGRSLGDLLRGLRISAKEVGILLVNGQDASADRRLSARDVVSVFPLIGGG
jgi:sulfur carrier protein ThiS